MPIYENKAKDASSKLSLFNKIQKEIERLTQLKDKAVKDEAAYESKASTIQNKAQENASTCTTKLAEQKSTYHQPHLAAEEQGGGLRESPSDME